MKDNVSSPLLVMSFGNNAYDMNDPSDSYALEVLFELMDGGFSSRFTKNITDKKILDEIVNLKKTLLNLNFQKSSGQLEKTSNIKKTKKEISRLKTKLVTLNGADNA